MHKRTVRSSFEGVAPGVALLAPRAVLARLIWLPSRSNKGEAFFSHSVRRFLKRSLR